MIDLLFSRRNSNEQSLTKKCKLKKIKEEKIIIPTVIPPISSLNSSPSENKNPNELIEQKQLSYSEVIQEANKLLAAEEPLTPQNNQTTTTATAMPLVNSVTVRVTKPIATVSPLHTSKNNPNRVNNPSEEDQLIDLSKPTIASYV